MERTWWSCTICPAEKCGNDLQDLELLRVGSFEGDEMEEVVRDELSGSVSKG